MGTSGTTRWLEETWIYRAYSVFGKDVEFHGVSDSPRLELRVLKEKESLEWSVCRSGLFVEGERSGLCYEVGKCHVVRKIMSYLLR
jgi:hypothetical protein